MTVLLTRRAVLQAAMETTYNDAASVGDTDGVLVSAPAYSADPTILERDFTRDTLSVQPHIVGRMLAKMEFTTELRGNGKEQAGTTGVAPIITRLFRACGYALTAHSASWCGTVFAQGDHATPVSWVSAGTLSNTDLICYHLTIDTGGASGTAKVTITSDTAGEGSASATITSGTLIDVGTKGLHLTPTWTGNLSVGDSWTVWLFPPGLSLDPVSDNFESITLVMHNDGVEHDMPGSFGTFEVTAEAGQYASIKWTFTGTYQAPSDSALPSPTYETTLPSQVQLGRLQVDSFQAVVDKFTFNQANDVQIRPDVSSAQGYIGTRIVSRKPEGGIDPEADLVANYDFWTKMANATRMPFQMRVGTVVGNTVWMLAPNVQYTKMTYTDRQGIEAYDAGLKFAGYQADDEIKFYFC